MEQDLIEQLKKLSVEELKNLLNEVQQTKTSVKRFENGVVCPICGKKHIQKFGNNSGIQRYRCKDFIRPFNGISTRYLTNYLNWFSWIKLGADNNLLIKDCLFGF